MYDYCSPHVVAGSLSGMCLPDTLNYLFQTFAKKSEILSEIEIFLKLHKGKRPKNFKK